MRCLWVRSLTGLFVMLVSVGNIDVLKAEESPAAPQPASVATDTSTGAGAISTEPVATMTLATSSEPVKYAVPDNEILSYSLDNSMLFIAAVLVIFMQAGFALVETGLNSAKNCVNILFKNTIDFCLGVIVYFSIGYALMYPGAEFKGNYFGYSQPDFSATVNPDEIKAGFAEGGTRKLHPQIDFLFQAAFCATAATIVSGAVAGRMKFHSYIICTALITGFLYPVVGFWKWGGGWLAEMGFHDFAGSLVVHSCGGFAALAGAMALGPRIGRYNAAGKPMPMPGHNIAFVTLGVFVLIIGWYGFNPGSQLAFAGTKNIEAISSIAVNTTLAGCAGGLVGTFLSWGLFGKPDLTMCLNGILAGLVSITAGCDCVTNHKAMIIGAVGGVLVVFGILLLDKLKIDDPVGAFPVHGINGVWAGIATGLFGADPRATLSVQMIGSLVIPAFSFGVMIVLFMFLKVTGQLRVSADEEIEGLDIHEHGMACYGFDSV